MKSGVRGVSRIVRLAAISGVSKGPGFLIPVIIAAFFGAGHATDAYFLAYGGLLLVGGTIGQPLEAAVVPFAAHALAIGGTSARHFMESLIRRGYLVGVGSAALGAILIGGAFAISPPQGVSLGEVFAFYALLAPAAIAWCVAGLYSGSLVSAWRLEAGAVGYGFRGVGALLGALIGAMMHRLWPVAIGVSVGEWGRVWWLSSHWFRAVAQLPGGAQGNPEHGFALAAGSQIAAQGMLSVAQFLERFLVGSIAAAAISWTEYANRLIMVAAVVFDGGVAPWLSATWSNARIRGELRSDWTTVYRRVTFAVVWACIVAGAIAVCAPTVVSLVLHHGAFTDSDAVVVTRLLRWYSLGYVFNMSSICIERLLLARTQNRLFAVLAGARAFLRIATIVSVLPRVGILALPIGYLVAESAYFCSLLAVSGREKTFQLSTSRV